jgi:CDP-diacylglycerol--serine O-phosphatidyltransferase
MHDEPSNALGLGVPRWRYVVPNAITSLSLLIGVLAIFRATQGQFVDAAWLIVWCILLDKLDGTAARLLGSTSEFGMQLDSLADLVTFGIAPGMLAFTFVWQDPHQYFAWWHSPMGNITLHAFISLYIVGACLRLAKFNVMSGDGGPKVFYGMPTTYAGGIVSLSLLVAMKFDMVGVIRVMPTIAMVCGFLMVGNLPLPKVTTRTSRGLQVFQITNLTLAYICGFARVYPEYLFVLMSGYGVIGFMWGYVHRHELRPDPDPEPQPG